MANTPAPRGHGYVGASVPAERTAEMRVPIAHPATMPHPLAVKDAYEVLDLCEGVGAFTADVSEAIGTLRAVNAAHESRRAKLLAVCEGIEAAAAGPGEVSTYRVRKELTR